MATIGIAAAGFAGGVASSYLAYRSKRAFDNLRQKVSDFLNDPFGFKRRAVEKEVKKFEEDMNQLEKND